MPPLAIILPPLGIYGVIFNKCIVTTQPEPEGQIARWIEQLQEYTFTILHRAGQKHGNADAMSRTSDEYNFTYKAILLPFLFHMSIIASRLSSESISGDSIAIFIKFDRLESLRQFLRRVLI